MIWSSIELLLSASEQMVHGVAKNDTIDEYLKIGQHGFRWCSINAINIHDPIPFNVPVSEYRGAVGEHVLNHQTYKNDSVLSHNSIRIEKLNLSLALLEIEADDEAKELHLQERFRMIDDAGILHHVQLVDLTEPLLIKEVLVDTTDEPAFKPFLDVLLFTKPSLTSIMSFSLNA